MMIRVCWTNLGDVFVLDQKYQAKLLNFLLIMDITVLYGIDADCQVLVCPKIR